MADRITIELDVAPVIARLDRLLGALGPQGMQAPLAEIGEDLVESVKRRFETSTAPDGSRWAPNAESTYLGLLAKTKNNVRKAGRISAQGARRVAGKKPLVDSGLLQDSIAYQIAGYSLFVGTNRFAGEWDGGAAVHQFGSKDGRIPARPFLGVDDADVAKMLDVLETYLARSA